VLDDITVLYYILLNMIVLKPKASGGRSIILVYMACPLHSNIPSSAISLLSKVVNSAVKQTVLVALMFETVAACIAGMDPASEQSLVKFYQEFLAKAETEALNSWTSLATPLLIKDKESLAVLADPHLLLVRMVARLKLDSKDVIMMKIVDSVSSLEEVVIVHSWRDDKESIATETYLCSNVEEKEDISLNYNGRSGWGSLCMFGCEYVPKSHIM
jgi:hypothetical protein